MKNIYRYLNITRVSYVEANDVFFALFSIEHSRQNSVATKSFLNSPEIRTKSPDDTFSNCLKRIGELTSPIFLSSTSTDE